MSEEAEKALRNFADWVISCSLEGYVLVRVSGTEGGSPYGRVVSLQDAVTDFLAEKER